MKHIVGILVLGARLIAQEIQAIEDWLDDAGDETYVWLAMDFIIPKWIDLK